MYTLKLNLPSAPPLKLLLWNFLSQWMLSSSIRLPQSTSESSETLSFPFLYSSSIQSTSLLSSLLIQYSSCIFILLQPLCYYISLSPHHLLVKWKSLSCVQFFETHGSYSPWNSPCQNTGVGSCSLLQGIFPTQESNGGLLHFTQILYQLSYQGSPTTFQEPPQIISLPQSILYTMIMIFSLNRNFLKTFQYIAPS